jgi:hypothetical protein
MPLLWSTYAKGSLQQKSAVLKIKSWLEKTPNKCFLDFNDQTLVSE